MDHLRTVFIVSDGTGITAEMLASSLLAQFGGLQFEKRVWSFVDNADKARGVATEIARAGPTGHSRPLVFSTLADPALRAILRESGAALVDIFEQFLPLLETELARPAASAMGRTHGIGEQSRYDERMRAVNFSVRADDGADPRSFESADIILLGVSRSGKTPACLYLALNYGWRAANYPLTMDDRPGSLPASLREHRAKLFGLTLSAQRLAEIRAGRRPHSQYASIEQCRRELAAAEELFLNQKIPYVDTTYMSVEEIAVTIRQQTVTVRQQT